MQELPSYSSTSSPSSAPAQAPDPIRAKIQLQPQRPSPMKHEPQRGSPFFMKPMSPACRSNSMRHATMSPSGIAQTSCALEHSGAHRNSWRPPPLEAFETARPQSPVPHGRKMRSQRTSQAPCDQDYNGEAYRAGKILNMYMNVFFVLYQPR